MGIGTNILSTKTRGCVKVIFRVLLDIIHIISMPGLETNTMRMLVLGTQLTIFDPTKGVDRPFILSGDGNDHSYMETGELWEYLPESDEWRQHSPHPGRSRWAPGSFVIGCDVYFTSGRDRYNGLMFNDLMMRRLC